jgi:DNA topoisomerase-2
MLLGLFKVFTNNMSNRTTPQITANSKNEEYTKITFKPDLARFHLTLIDDDFEALLKKRVYDLAGCLRGVKVFLNDTRIKIKVSWYIYHPHRTSKNILICT